MDEYECLMDWDLEAIVRGISSSEATMIIDHPNDPNSNFSCLFQDEILDSFPEFSETTRVLDDLEELYKPFYPLSPHTIVATNSLPITKEPQQVKASKKVAALQVPAASKCKRSKKSQNKSLVKSVTTAEGLDDSWAWRKYGQKPIKGSPYPRSYYRCSSSKGCLARKQVERSNLDPSVFLVTYTAEHTHPHPTRRNSLAGTTRKNNALVAPSSTSTNCSSKSNSSAVIIHSPRTPLVVQSIEDDALVTLSVEQSNNDMELKKEEDFDFDWLDNDGEGGWFPSTDLEELIGLEYQQLLH
ncbi:hypothetical protein RJT34_02880 [Clitoria ternatea]|uniref:WRKY domain-containing protein n=1 Tax=Clitoria ternatea TaxID=43366 RepID=A0AAN9KJS1_CLITE